MASIQPNAGARPAVRSTAPAPRGGPSISSQPAQRNASPTPKLEAPPNTSGSTSTSSTSGSATSAPLPKTPASPPRTSTAVTTAASSTPGAATAAAKSVGSSVLTAAPKGSNRRATNDGKIILPNVMGKGNAAAAAPASSSSSSTATAAGSKKTAQSSAPTAATAASASTSATAASVVSMSPVVMSASAVNPKEPVLLPALSASSTPTASSSTSSSTSSSLSNSIVYLPSLTSASNASSQPPPASVFAFASAPAFISSPILGPTTVGVTTTMPATSTSMSLDNAQLHRNESNPNPVVIGATPGANINTNANTANNNINNNTATQSAAAAAAVTAVPRPDSSPPPRPTSSQQHHLPTLFPNPLTPQQQHHQQQQHQQGQQGQQQQSRGILSQPVNLAPMTISSSSNHTKASTPTTTFPSPSSSLSSSSSSSTTPLSSAAAVTPAGIVLPPVAHFPVTAVSLASTDVATKTHTEVGYYERLTEERERRIALQQEVLTLRQTVIAAQRERNDALVREAASQHTLQAHLDSLAAERAKMEEEKAVFVAQTVAEANAKAREDELRRNRIQDAQLQELKRQWESDLTVKLTSSSKEEIENLKAFHSYSVDALKTTIADLEAKVKTMSKSNDALELSLHKTSLQRDRFMKQSQRYYVAFLHLHRWRKLLVYMCVKVFLIRYRFFSKIRALHKTFYDLVASVSRLTAESKSSTPRSLWGAHPQPESDVWLKDAKRYLSMYEGYAERLRLLPTPQTYASASQREAMKASYLQITDDKMWSHITEVMGVLTAEFTGMQVRERGWREACSREISEAQTTVLLRQQANQINVLKRQLEEYMSSPSSSSSSSSLVSSSSSSSHGQTGSGSGSGGSSSSGNQSGHGVVGNAGNSGLSSSLSALQRRHDASSQRPHRSGQLAGKSNKDRATLFSSSSSSTSSSSYAASAISASAESSETVRDRIASADRSANVDADDAEAEAEAAAAGNSTVSKTDAVQARSNNSCADSDAAIDTDGLEPLPTSTSTSTFSSNPDIVYPSPSTPGRMPPAVSALTPQPPPPPQQQQQPSSGSQSRSPSRNSINGGGAAGAGSVEDVVKLRNQLHTQKQENLRLNAMLKQLRAALDVAVAGGRQTPRAVYVTTPESVTVVNVTQPAGQSNLTSLSSSPSSASMFLASSRPSTGMTNKPASSSFSSSSSSSASASMASPIRIVATSRPPTSGPPVAPPSPPLSPSSPPLASFSSSSTSNTSSRRGSATFSTPTPSTRATGKTGARQQVGDSVSSMSSSSSSSSASARKPTYNDKSGAQPQQGTPTVNTRAAISSAYKSVYVPRDLQRLLNVGKSEKVVVGGGGGGSGVSGGDEGAGNVNVTVHRISNESESGHKRDAHSLAFQS